MNGKDNSQSSGQSGTTGLFSTNRKKKNAVYIKNTYMIRECIYKGQFHNTYKVSCIPKILHVGEEKINGSTYFVKVTESYGPSIKILYSLMGNHLQLASICVLAINMLNVIEEIHKANIVHRNIKPRKIVIHNDLKNASLYLIDFKYARKYKHKNGQPVRYNENSRILNKVFCNKFSSIGTHLGISPSRKDDMESLGYIFIYFFRKGNIFGNKQFKTREEKLKYYEEWKLSFIPETMNQEMPQEFINYLNYIKSMNILDPPEYEMWKKQFKLLLQKIGISQNDHVYEWIPRIKNDMVQQYGNSFLQDLDTPSATSKNLKEISKSSLAAESEYKQKDHIVSNAPNSATININPEEAPTSPTKENQKQQSEPTTASANPEQSQSQIQKQQSSIHETQETAKAGGYYYGPIEIDMTDIQKQTVHSNITFGADSEHKNNHFQSNNNGSILDNMSAYKQKSQINPSSHLSKINTSNYSTDDLSICDDETQNSLSSQLSRHNNIIMTQPFFFKFKKYD